MNHYLIDRTGPTHLDGSQNDLTIFLCRNSRFNVPDGKICSPSQLSDELLRRSFHQCDMRTVSLPESRLVLPVL
jgi:hypothetical protein